MPRKRKPPALPTRRGRGSGSIARRQDGRYQVQLPRSLDPSRRAYYFLSQVDARAWLDQQLAAQVTDLLARQNPLLGEYLEQWFYSHSVSLSPSTRESYQRAIRYLSPIAAIRVRELRPADLQQVQSDLLRDGKAPRTIIHARRVWSVAFNAAVPDLLPFNPLLKIRPPRPRERAAEQSWTVEQVRIWLAATEQDPLQALWRLQVTLGVRPGEAAALRWEHLDLEHGTIALGSNLSRHGKTVGPLKAGRLRVVPMPAPLVAAFQRHRAEQVPRRAWVFANPAGDPYNPDSFARLFQVHRERAGLPPLVLYGLRHTAATLLVSAGVPVTQVSAMLGHARTSMTVDVYAHAQRSDATQAASTLGELLP